MSDAEQAVSLAIPRAQQGLVHLGELNLLAEAVKSGQPLAAVRAEIARQVDSGALIKLDSVAGAGNRVLVPRVAYEMEKTIIRHIAEGKEAVQPLMALTPASVLAGLTAGQREATRTVLENTDRFMAIQGYAGVGKTTQFRAVMGALNTLSESVRPQVIGLGPTHRAVHEMREAGVDARTLASFLSETRLAIQGGETPDFRNVLFLTDESSMVGNRDMAELYQLVAAGGGRMVSSGDTAQLQAISTGLPFRLVQQRSAIDTVVMQEIVRQTPALRPAIESIIAGQVALSLHQVDDVTPQQVPRQEGAWVPENSVMEIRAPKKDPEQGYLVASGQQAQSVEQLALVRTDIIEAIRDDWMGRTREAQQQTLVVAELNADRHAINEAIHAARREKGDTGAEERTFTVLEPLRAPYVALPVWTRHGKEAGALLTEIRIEDDGMRVVLSEESRLRGGEDAQFAGLQASRNGQTLIADDAQTALRLAQENPESGVVIRLHGEEKLLNAARLTEGRITEPDEVARTVRSVAEAEAAAKAEDPITLPADEQQKLAETQEKAARALAEQARQELLPAVPRTESDRSDPLLSARDERRLRDGTDRDTRELDEAVREAVAEGRGPRQQVREQMERTEREWVVNVPEKAIELEKTLGGD